MKSNKAASYMTTDGLFKEIITALKVTGKYPADILDYANSAGEDLPIKTTEFSPVCMLDFGGSEGIYLDVGIHFGREAEECRLGTFKTLYENEDAMETMGKLMGDFVYQRRKFVCHNYDAFDRSGFSVRGVNANGEEGHYSLLADTLEGAEKRIPELTGNKEFVKGIIFDKDLQKIVKEVVL